MQKTTAVMIDIETLGLGPASVILSIGAVRFNPFAVPGTVEMVENPAVSAFDDAQSVAQMVPDTFYKLVDPIEQQVRYGLQVEASTVMWWLTDESITPEARSAFGNKNAQLPLEAVLAELAGWLALGGGADTPIWSNGSLDINVLTTAYHVGGYGRPPWKYDAVRDYRTIAKEFGYCQTEEEWTHASVKHNALADATAQATNLQRIYNRAHAPHVAADGI